MLIRSLLQDDIHNLVTDFCFPWSTADATHEKWINYYEEQQDQARIVAIVEQEQQLIGYGSLLLKSNYFSQIPEIHDLWIAAKNRRTGFGKQLMAYLENLARAEGYKKIGFGVGLYKDYGPAQKLYFQMGFQPDGEGITYQGGPVTPGEKYPIDDDLILWLTKSL